MKFLAGFSLLLALFSPLSAEAVDRYYSRCDTGAHASCVAGNDANDGLSAASPKLTAPTGTQINAAACGDRFLFAEGGRWNGYGSGNVDAARDCSTNPVVFDSYAPASGATGKPRLHRSTAGPMFQMGNYDNTTMDRGYLFRNLYLSAVNGTASYTDYTSDYAFQVFGRMSHLTMDNLTLDGFRIALYVQGTAADSPAQVSFITLKNSIVTNMFSMGILGAANDFNIINNTFSNINYSGSAGNHAIYIGISQSTAERVTIRGNYFDRISRDLLGVDGSVGDSDSASGICEGGNVTVHAVDLQQLVIEDNVLYQEDSAQTCYGISMTTGYPGYPESHTGIIRRNRVINMGECGICISSSLNSIVENNEVSNFKTLATHMCIFVTPDTDVLQNNNIIRNNSCYLHNVQFGEGVSTLNLYSATGNVVVNNLTIFGSGSGTQKECYAVTLNGISSYAYYGYNWCYNSGGAGVVWSQGYSSLANAQAAGFDVSGVLGTNPQLSAVPSSANGWRIILSPGSPAKTAGNLARCARLDARGRVRTGGTCEVGAAS